MIKYLIPIIVWTTSQWACALVANPDKGHTCKGHVEEVNLYEGKLKAELAFKPERSFYDVPNTQDNSTFYVDKAQLTINVQMDDAD